MILPCICFNYLFRFGKINEIKSVFKTKFIFSNFYSILQKSCNGDYYVFYFRKSRNNDIQYE